MFVLYLPYSLSCQAEAYFSISRQGTYFKERAYIRGNMVSMSIDFTTCSINSIQICFVSTTALVNEQNRTSTVSRSYELLVQDVSENIAE